MRALTAVRTAPFRAAVRLQTARATDDAGMTTAEYAVGTVAACGFGGILYKVITSGAVLELITGVISRAFKLNVLSGSRPRPGRLPAGPDLPGGDPSR